MRLTRFYSLPAQVLLLVITGVLLNPCWTASAEVAQPQNVVLSTRHASAPQIVQKHVSFKPAPYRGWSYLVERLRQDGVSDSQLKSVYLDTRMPTFTFIPFGVQPREGRGIYRDFRKEERLKVARDFLVRNKKIFDQAEKIFRVNRFTIAAILLVETHAGQATGRDLVLNRLSRLASVGEPTNVMQNFKRLLQDDPNVSFEQVKARADYLEETFYPEVRALFELARKQNMDILKLRGSSAGAFGLPQFLPSSFLRFAVDGNKDGVTSLYQEADAVWSIANYLSHFGWQDSAALESKRKVLWRYNHSDAYIDTLIDVADLLK